MNINTDPKSFFSLIKLKGKVQSHPSIMKSTGGVTYNGPEISSAFAKQFAANYSSKKPVEFNIRSTDIKSFDIPTPSIDTGLVLQYLKKLEVKFNAGPDNIPTNILFYCCEQLALPLSILFKQSLSSGVFPTL